MSQVLKYEPGQFYRQHHDQAPAFHYITIF